jgi:signal transduction histidine kinase
MQMTEMATDPEAPHTSWEGTNKAATPPADSCLSQEMNLGSLLQAASSIVNIVARYPRLYEAGLEQVLVSAKSSLSRPGSSVRHARPQLVHVDLAVCLAEIEALTLATWEPDVKVLVRIDADLPPIFCDPLALQSAVLNVLLNAREAMPRGGVVLVRARTAWPEDYAHAIEIQITDSGIGMNPATMSRAFEPFFTTKPGGLGGLGLPMTQRFVEEAGGHILLESMADIGTTVTIYLPSSNTVSD